MKGLEKMKILPNEMSNCSITRQGSPVGEIVKALKPTILGCLSFRKISASNRIRSLYLVS